jgi:beta-lactamase class A
MKLTKKIDNISKHINIVIYFTIIAIVAFAGGAIFGSMAQKENAVAYAQAKSKKDIPVIPLTTKTQKESQTQKQSMKQYVSTLNKKTRTLVDSTAGHIGITYLDLNTGESFSINGQKKFFAASTNKVPLVMKISDLVNKGELTWEQSVKYRKSDYEAGTGRLQALGKEQVSIKTLTRYAVVYSDNIAKNMLFRQVAPTYPNGIKALYKSFLPGESTNGENRFSTDDMAKILNLLYEGKGENAGYQMLYDNMKHTEFHDRLETPLTAGHVAHKIGSNGTEFNDIGIFEGKHPFILTVSTNHVPNASDFISSVADLIYTAQTNNYGK